MSITTSLSRAIVAALTLSLTGTALAKSAPEELSAPTPIDFADVRTKTDALIAEIVAGEASEALRAALSENVILAEKTSQLNLLVNQYDSIVSTYGNPKQCVGLEQHYQSSLRITTSYVCQHRDFLVYWEFHVDRLPKGWTYSTIRFNSDF